MRPLQARCHRGRGSLYAETGRRQQAREDLSTAIALYRTMDLQFWLPQAEKALAQVTRGAWLRLRPCHGSARQNRRRGPPLADHEGADLLSESWPVSAAPPPSLMCYPVPGHRLSC
jgi:hypothetical protein